MAESAASSVTIAEHRVSSQEKFRPFIGSEPVTVNEPRVLDLEKAEAEKVPAAPGLHDPKSFPDGGFEAWLVVSGGFFCLFCSFGWINCIGIFQAYYQENQLKNLSPSTIAWIPSLEVFMMFVGGPIWGKLYDRNGPRNLLMAGTILHVFGLMMASLRYFSKTTSTTTHSSCCLKYFELLSNNPSTAQPTTNSSCLKVGGKTLFQASLIYPRLGICSPIGASMIFYPAMSAVGTWFHKNRALALGVMASGSSLGGVIFPIMIKKLVVEVGFAWSMRIAAFFILALLIYSNMTLRSRLSPTRKPWSLKEFLSPFRERTYSLVVVASFFFFFGMFLPFTYIVLEAEYYGMSANLAGYLVSILNAVSIFGRTVPGYVADRIGRFNTMIVTAYLSATLVLALWIPARGNVPIILFSTFYGFSSGAFVSLAPALIAQISDIRQIGMRTGIMFAVISLAALTGSPIGGALQASEGGKYLYLQIFCGVMMVAGSTVFVLARVSLAGPGLKKKV
ncbi:hypothetical protein MMC29_002319 [Sticta canariensis]|nr:hypothetical protein [Sticta canariensis]